MQVFDDCVCIAQARVIAGTQKEPHVCTIALHEPTGSFLRFCLPFSNGKTEEPIRRWHRFRFRGTKENLEARETRRETYYFGAAEASGVPIKDSEKRKAHQLILSNFKHERDLNCSRDSIGICVPHGPMQFKRRDLHPNDGDYDKYYHHMEAMKAHGNWYPDFKLQVSGKVMRDGELRPFKKQLLAWDFFEAFRHGDVDPFQQVKSYREPYMIIGNHIAHRISFMVIGILSAPPGTIQAYAVNHQLQLAL